MPSVLFVHWLTCDALTALSFSYLRVTRFDIRNMKDDSVPCYIFLLRNIGSRVYMSKALSTLLFGGIVKVIIT